MSDGAQMVANRLRKNMRNLSRWLRNEDIHCYRLYDADIPEYAIAVDAVSYTHLTLPTTDVVGRCRWSAGD